MRLKTIIAAITLAAGLARPCDATPTLLEVPAKAAWKHAKSGLILGPSLAGLQRGEISDHSDDELDVSVQYGTSDPTSVTIYVFRPALQHVAIWFDRSEAEILKRDIYANPSGQVAALAFPHPKSRTASGLRRIYVPRGGQFKSTGLAVMPLGEWLVAVRISSVDLDASALDRKMTEAIEDIGWPDGTKDAEIAVPVADCTSPLAYDKKAKLKKPDMAQTLLGAALITAAKDGSEEKTGPAKPVVWCRESTAAEYGVYRANGSTNSYVMALGDAGNVINVSPALALDDRGAGYALTLGQLDKTLVFQSFNRLPSPDKAMDAVMRTDPVSSVNGNNITINN